LLAELHPPEINFRAVEDTIKCDATLSCNLLRYMNSAAMGIREPITSIAQALRMLGERPLRKWGSLVTMASLNECGAEEILTTSLVRARFCEEMAPIAGEQEHELDYFLVGIFSLIDAITGQPMRQTILGLPLQDRVRQTLLGERDSNLGRALQIIEACERGGWATVDAACTALQVSQQEIAIRYYDALHWAHQTLTSGDHAA